MAIVFISPKKRQKILIYILLGLICFILIIIALRIFLIKPKPIPPGMVFIPPEIKINFEILKSEQVKNLELFEGVKKEFNYQGRTETGEIQTGKIKAVSNEKAQELLEELGLSEIELTEMEISRENPFLPYEVSE
jgi:hypothetical protein